MTTLSNREKNILHEARNDARVRPANPVYNFAELDRVVRAWTDNSVTEVYSPYLGAV